MGHWWKNKQSCAKVTQWRPSKVSTWGNAWWPNAKETKPDEDYARPTT